VHRALGSDFERLHPRIQQQYGICSDDSAAYIGTGVMHEIWHGRWYVVPFLHVGSIRRILFPETGQHVPFQICNYAYADQFGRETVTWKRKFCFPKKTREFDEFFVYSELRKTPILYAGTHQHLSVDLKFTVDAEGALIVTTGAQRLFAGPFTIRWPRFFSGDAYVKESYNDELERFEVDVTIANRFWGKILGYRGFFDLERVDCTVDQIPEGIKPVRESNRE
jgi:hypothetical protein